MGKQKYKSHEDLGISFAEWGALWGFKAIAEAGIVLKHVPDGAPLQPDTLLTLNPNTHFFDMSRSCFKHGCGAVACIGGTVGLFTKMSNPVHYVETVDKNAHHALHALYYPEWKNGNSIYLRGRDNHSHNWHKITLKMAAKAVDNFLRTGKPNWENVIPKSMRYSQ